MKNLNEKQYKCINNKRGVTLVTLVITIIVLLIIASISIYVGTDIIKKANLQNINTNMMLIQAKTKTIYEQERFNHTTNYKGTKITEVTGNSAVDELMSKNVLEDADKFYLLTQNDLNDMGLEKISIDKGYAVNYETEEIIYIKGFEANNSKYYKLSEMKNLNIE